MPSLTGKIALITGASSGIGFGIAEHFATLGASVIVHAHHEDNAQSAAARLEAAGYDSTAVAADLRDVGACRGMVHAAIAWKGGLDVLVNNAGMTDRGQADVNNCHAFCLLMLSSLPPGDAGAAHPESI